MSSIISKLSENLKQNISVAVSLPPLLTSLASLRTSRHPYTPSPSLFSILTDYVPSILYPQYPPISYSGHRSPSAPPVSAHRATGVTIALKKSARRTHLNALYGDLRNSASNPSSGHPLSLQDYKKRDDTYYVVSLVCHRFYGASICQDQASGAPELSAGASAPSLPSALTLSLF